MHSEDKQFTRAIADHIPGALSRGPLLDLTRKITKYKQYLIQMLRFDHPPLLLGKVDLLYLQRLRPNATIMAK